MGLNMNKNNSCKEILNHPFAIKRTINSKFKFNLNSNKNVVVIKTKSSSVIFVKHRQDSVFIAHRRQCPERIPFWIENVHELPFLLSLGWTGMCQFKREDWKIFPRPTKYGEGFLTLDMLRRYCNMLHFSVSVELD